STTGLAFAASWADARAEPWPSVGAARRVGQTSARMRVTTPALVLRRRGRAGLAAPPAPPPRWPRLAPAPAAGPAPLPAERRAAGATHRCDGPRRTTDRSRRSHRPAPSDAA